MGKVENNWLLANKLPEEASQLRSLQYFNPNFYSINFPTKAYQAAGVNRYEVSKLNIQMIMLSGRYRTANLCRFWTSNKEGFCLTGYPCENEIDTISHILVGCKSLHHKRSQLKRILMSRKNVKDLMDLVAEVFIMTDEKQTQFLLEPLSNPKIITLTQKYGSIITEQVCYLTRTYCFSIHKERLLILKEKQN